MAERISVSARCIAELLTSSQVAWKRLLVPFKYKNEGEGAGRGSYYKPALDAIKKYCRSNRDVSVLNVARASMQKARESASRRSERTKWDRNLAAVDSYERIYGNRRFTVLPNHRLSCSLHGVRITAQPDLWVKEFAHEVLMKIGASRKNSSYVDVLLYLMRKAAVSSGFRVRSRNIVYLDIEAGVERCCNSNLTRFNRSFRFAALGIERLWPAIGPPVTRRNNPPPLTGSSSR